MKNSKYNDITSRALEQAGVNPGSSTKLLWSLLNSKEGSAVSLISMPYLYATAVGKKTSFQSLREITKELSSLVDQSGENLEPILNLAREHAQKYSNPRVTGEDILYALSEADPNQYGGSRFLREKGWNGEKVDSILAAAEFARAF